MIGNKIKKKYGRAHARKKRRGWYIHLLIFVIVQLVFSTFDGFSDWPIFNLNPYGEWFVYDLNPLGEWFQIYKSQEINLLNFIWVITLIIHGLGSLSYTIWPRKDKTSTSSY
ncbi:hypothetical protein LG329_17960 [Virgibacillus necropolis]|uniref:YfzA family protein n=1 Tax=Virgibacillus necropolis TaxID=163877 RepID=UPI00384E0942